ncbi:MAG TPA: prephenate dehydratase [Acidobacteriota bacterium]|nr:prephenate dehydratase [Acidobacteriota bacterium]
MKAPFCRRLRGVRIAIQGERGSFSHRASVKIFGHRNTTLHGASFEEVFEKVTSKTADIGVIPIENSLAGSIHKNYDLLARHALEVIGETFLRVEHKLIAHPGVDIKKIRHVYSHQAALDQCSGLLKKLRDIQIHPFYDTAGSVKHIRDERLHDAAAIASEEAARLYRMDILVRGIEDDPENYTRFLALAKRGKFIQGGEKTSIVFGLRNETGILFKALSVFALRNIDLTKIESRPIRGKPWQYLFYLDLRSDIRSRECVNALRHLREMAPYLKILGSYSAV